MGSRSVIMFDNDMHYIFRDDKFMCEKVADAILETSAGKKNTRVGSYACLVESVPHSTQTLAVLSDSYQFNTISHRQFFNFKSTDEQQALELLKDAAAKLGYRLVK